MPQIQLDYVMEKLNSKFPVFSSFSKILGLSLVFYLSFQTQSAAKQNSVFTPYVNALIIFNPARM